MPIPRTERPQRPIWVEDDLEAALKFTLIALNSGKHTKIVKYRARARERYDRIVAAIGDTEPDVGVKIKLAWLVGDLRELGESVPDIPAAARIRLTETSQAHRGG
jgi:hypothetical protein